MLLSVVPAIKAETSLLSASEDAADRLEKDNELFQQLPPNGIHLPDSSDDEPPPRAHCSAHHYALVNSLPLPIAPIYNSSEVITNSIIH